LHPCSAGDRAIRTFHRRVDAEKSHASGGTAGCFVFLGLDPNVLPCTSNNKSGLFAFIDSILRANDSYAHASAIREVRDTVDFPAIA
jgi:hypothetical protein